MEKIIYLLVMISFLASLNILFIYLDNLKEKRRIREQRRLNARFYETIDYTNFNPETGKYEN